MKEIKIIEEMALVAAFDRGGDSFRFAEKRFGRQRMRDAVFELLLSIRKCDETSRLKVLNKQRLEDIVYVVSRIKDLQTLFSVDLNGIQFCVSEADTRRAIIENDWWGLILMT